MGIKLNVLYQSSDLYAPIASVAITSLLENNKHFEEIHIFILNDGISEVNRNKMSAHVHNYGRKLTFLDARLIITRLEALAMPKWRNTYTIYCKLFASTLLPDELDRILYLDSDTLVCGPLDELAVTDLTDAPCAMALAPNYNKHKLFVGLSEKDLYFEAGTIYFNMDYWRKHHVEDQIISYVKSPESAYYAADMDILNVLFSAVIKKLPLRFCVCTGMYLYSSKQVRSIYQLNDDIFYTIGEIDVAKAQPFICHFSGGGIDGRPWEEGNVQPMSPLWEKYADMSPWKGWKKKRPELPAYLKIQRLIYRFLPAGLYTPLHSLALHVYFKRKVSSLVKVRKASGKSA